MLFLLHLVALPQVHTTCAEQTVVHGTTSTPSVLNIAVLSP